MDFEYINQSDYLNVTDSHLQRMKVHIDRDAELHELKLLVMHGWPIHKEDTSLGMRDYWAVRDALRMEFFSKDEQLSS